MSVLSLQDLLPNLVTGPIEPLPADGRRRAAVAAVVHDGALGPAVLLMKRAEAPGDPWSGQIALPGGRAEPRDLDLLTTARRETHEELAVQLADVPVLGRLGALHPFASGPHGMEVTPFVFVVTTPPTVQLSREAAATFWLPLGPTRAGAYDDRYLYAPRGVEFPAWTYQGHTIWGLTYRILSELIGRAR